MRHLQQAGGECISPAMLRSVHMRALYANPPQCDVPPCILADWTFFSCAGQTALSDTCPVCAHTPVSPDLCKPNKALRTTLKAFLRTEEKKREKERQSAATPTPVADTPAQSEHIPTEVPTDQNGTEEVAPQAQVAQIPQITESDQAPVENSPVETKKPDTVDNDASKMADPVAEVWLYPIIVL